MPKVSDLYYEEKRREIISVTKELCKEKPIFTITITDVIRATGYSQGAIYRYYKDMDEIIVALLNQSFEEASHFNYLDQLFSKDAAPEQIIPELFARMALHVTDTLGEYQKFSYELSIVHFAYPARYEKMIGKIKEVQVNQSVITEAFQYISDKTEAGYFTPRIPLADIFSFAVTSYDGIMRDVLLSKQYKLKTANLPPVDFDEGRLFSTLGKTILFLLNGEGA